jgi:hypothetical protein
MCETVKWSAGVLFGLAALVLVSSSAIADTSADTRISVPSSGCPQSVADRHPLIECRTTVAGTQVIAGRTGNDTWENSRATPGTHPFVNGGGHFGKRANR